MSPKKNVMYKNFNFLNKAEELPLRGNNQSANAICENNKLIPTKFSNIVKTKDSRASACHTA